MRIIKIVILILVINVFGCQKEVNRKFPLLKVAVNDTNEIAISDSIYFIAPDLLPNKVTIISEIADAHLNYSVNNSAYTRIPIEPITLQKQDTVLQFYLTKPNFENSETRTIVFQRQSKKYLNRVEVSSRVSDSSLNLYLKDKSRGIIEVEVFNVMGQRLLHRNHVKNADVYTIKYALAEYSPGVYIVVVTYGKDQKGYRFLKE